MITPVLSAHKKLRISADNFRLPVIRAVSSRRATRFQFPTTGLLVLCSAFIPSLFQVTFHYVGTGGSGIEALVHGVAVGANGDIVVVGDQVTFAQSGNTIVNGIARLTPAGNLDPTFGNGGIVVNNIPATSAVAIQPDGNIVTVGFGGNNNGLTLARYLGN